MGGTLSKFLQAVERQIGVVVLFREPVVVTGMIDSQFVAIDIERDVADLRDLVTEGRETAHGFLFAFNGIAPGRHQPEAALRYGFVEFGERIAVRREPRVLRPRVLVFALRQKRLGERDPFFESILPTGGARFVGHVSLPRSVARPLAVDVRRKVSTRVGCKGATQGCHVSFMQNSAHQIRRIRIRARRNRVDNVGTMGVSVSSKEKRSTIGHPLPKPQKQHMPKNTRRKAPDEVRCDGHAGEIALFEAVHHADVDAQEAGETDSYGREDADVLCSYNVVLKKLRDECQAQRLNEFSDSCRPLSARRREFDRAARSLH